MILKAVTSTLSQYHGKQEHIQLRDAGAVYAAQGILDSFEITEVEEEVTSERDETGTIIRILHIWLEERDLREKVWHDLRPNGFTEYRAFNDFPQREHKVLLHVRRRRWLDNEGHSVILDSPALTAEGTCYSAEFAGFLKKIIAVR